MAEDSVDTHNTVWSAAVAKAPLGGGSRKIKVKELALLTGDSDVVRIWWDWRVW